MSEFTSFPKIPRLSKGFWASEKIDGTNAQIHIFRPFEETGNFYPQLVAAWHDGGYVMQVGSRNRYIHPGDDNFGFAAWVKDNSDELWKLGPGRHYGEWFGPGIQKNPLGVSERRFALFNPRWADQGPSCVEVVPQLGLVFAHQVPELLANLEQAGTQVEGGNGRPEGVILYHEGSKQSYKITYDYDEGKFSGR